MRSVSRRFRAHLGFANTWVSECDWTNDGGKSWTPAQVIAGSVTASTTSQVHWQVRNLRLRGVTAGLNGINEVTTQIRLRQGLEWGPGDRELLSLGRYRVLSSTELLETDGALVIDADSHEDYVIQGQLTEPLEIDEQLASITVGTLLRKVFREPEIYWDPRVPDQVLPYMAIERDLWGALSGDNNASSVMNALGALIYPDADNIWRVVPRPTLQADPSFVVASGSGGMLLDGSQVRDNTNVRNQVVVTGTGAGLVGPVMAQDNDPLSLTYLNRAIEDGGCGPRPEFYESELILDEDQAMTVAQARLATHLGQKQQVTFSSHYDPTKEPGDVGLAASIRVILDEVTYDLAVTPGPLQCTTRATASSLYGGAPVELAEE